MNENKICTNKDFSPDNADTEESFDNTALFDSNLDTATSEKATNSDWALVANEQKDILESHSNSAENAILNSAVDFVATRLSEVKNREIVSKLFISTKKYIREWISEHGYDNSDSIDLLDTLKNIIEEGLEMDLEYTSTNIKMIQDDSSAMDSPNTQDDTSTVIKMIHEHSDENVNQVKSGATTSDNEDEISLWRMSVAVFNENWMKSFLSNRRYDVATQTTDCRCSQTSPCHCSLCRPIPIPSRDAMLDHQHKKFCRDPSCPRKNRVQTVRVDSEEHNPGPSQPDKMIDTNLILNSSFSNQWYDNVKDINIHFHEKDNDVSFCPRAYFHDDTEDTYNGDQTNSSSTLKVIQQTPETEEINPFKNKIKLSNMTRYCPRLNKDENDILDVECVAAEKDGGVNKNHTLAQSTEDIKVRPVKFPVEDEDDNSKKEIMCTNANNDDEEYISAWI